MSWAAVDFHLVRYSPVEGTHWFFDPQHPTAVQFLLNSRWESWDVGWVRQRAQDPDIKRIAEDAEARLIQDPTSAYRAWPAPRPSLARDDLSAAVNDQVPSSRRALPSSLVNGESSATTAQHHHHNHSQSPLSPTSSHFSSHGQPLQSPSYLSPYSSQPTPLGQAVPFTTAPRQARETTPSQQSIPTHANTGATVRPPGFSLLEKVPDSPTPTPPPAATPTWMRRRHLPPQPPSTSNGNPSVTYQQPQDISVDPALRDTPPPSLPISNNRETKILLSLDGDGVRGLSAVLLVESLVNAICSRISRRVDPYQIFDLIGGVSTGGLIAILLGRIRMRAHRARDAYINIAKEVFQDKLRFFVSLDPHAPRQESEDHALQAGIMDLLRKENQDPEERFFDERPDATNVFAISTKVEIGSNQAAIVRTYPTRRMAGPEIDPDIRVWQAISATLAAPKYIDPLGGRDRRAVIEPGLVDYGTAKNNPMRDVFYECRKLCSYASDTMVIVSIGTGSGCDRLNEVNEMANSVEDRKADAKFAGDKFELDMRDLRERGWMKYFRFNVPDLHDVPLDESSQVDRIMEKTHAYLADPEISQQFYGCVEAIATILMSDLNIRSRA